MIVIKNLDKIYKSSSGDIVALKDINLHIGKGEIYGIIGLSGAGKSTLIRCINLLERPDSGTIEIDGHDITRLQGAELRRLRSSLGMIFQHFNLLMQRNVEDNIAFPLEIAKLPKKQANERVRELLELVGLSDKAKSFPSQLSGGQKQRVAIARALANNPKVLLCDEATSALDPMTTKSILALLKDINQKLGITIVLITHEMGVIREICSTVTVIDSSSIVETGRVIDLVANPRSEAARRLFGGFIPKEVLLKDFNVSGIQHSKRVKIKFSGEDALKPLISSMILEFGVYANILFGNIDLVQDTLIGEMLLDISGEKDAVENALKYLNHRNLLLEELKT